MFIKHSHRVRCLVIVFVVYDSLAEKRANKFARGVCDVFVSYWLEFLIHIHSNLTVFAHFKLFVDE